MRDKPSSSQLDRDRPSANQWFGADPAFYTSSDDSHENLSEKGFLFIWSQALNSVHST